MRVHSGRQAIPSVLGDGVQLLPPQVKLDLTRLAPAEAVMPRWGRRTGAAPLHSSRQNRKVGKYTWTCPNDIRTAKYRYRLQTAVHGEECGKTMCRTSRRSTTFFVSKGQEHRRLSVYTRKRHHHNHNVNSNEKSSSLTSGSSLAPRLSASRTSIFLTRTTPNSTSGNSSSASPCACETSQKFRGRNDEAKQEMGEESQLYLRACFGVHFFFSSTKRKYREEANPRMRVESRVWTRGCFRSIPFLLFQVLWEHSMLSSC